MSDREYSHDPIFCQVPDNRHIQGIFQGDNGPAGKDSLNAVAENIRWGALFIGIPQFCTFCVFFYILIEAVGLWLRWVVPRNVLYSVIERNGVTTIDPGNAPTLQAAVVKFAGSRMRSLGDRLFARVLRAGAEPIRSPATAHADRDLEANQGLIGTLESYRNFLQDDAAARQESLEVLSDTMLKLAFMGTVFGISKALYSARGLDAADPLARLVAKSEMYSGIGIGFGATLVGILLSIVAAAIRSHLSKSWMQKIGTAYSLILDYGVAGFRTSAAMLDKADVDRLRPRPPPRSTRLGILERLGAIVVIVIFLAGLLMLLKRFGA